MIRPETGRDGGEDRAVPPEAPGEPVNAAVKRQDFGFFRNMPAWIEGAVLWKASGAA